MVRRDEAADRELQPEDLPNWIFRTDYRPSWTQEPDEAEWGRQIREWIEENAPHLIYPRGHRWHGRYVKAFSDEERRRRHGRAPSDPVGYRHPDSRDGAGGPWRQPLLPPGVDRLPPGPPTPPLPDPRWVLRGDDFDPPAGRGPGSQS